MPHALPMPPSGFQALILCGPGVSLNTFTSNPEDFPKALIPIANRPMIWYPLDWCYRMGITSRSYISPVSTLCSMFSMQRPPFSIVDVMKRAPKLLFMSKFHVCEIAHLFLGYVLLSLYISSIDYSSPNNTQIPQFSDSLSIACCLVGCSDDFLA